MTVTFVMKRWMTRLEEVLLFLRSSWRKKGALWFFSLPMQLRYQPGLFPGSGQFEAGRQLKAPMSLFKIKYAGPLHTFAPK